MKQCHIKYAAIYMELDKKTYQYWVFYTGFIAVNFILLINIILAHCKFINIKVVLFQYNEFHLIFISFVRASELKET